MPQKIEKNLAGDVPFYRLGSSIYMKRQIRGLKSKVKCPSFKNLIDHLEGLLPQQMERKIRAHLLEGCPACTGDLRFLEEDLRIGKGSLLEEPPSNIVRRAWLAFRQAKPTVRSSVAKLVLDSRRLPGYAETRTGGIRPVYLLYRAEEIDLELLLQAGGRGKGRTLFGEVSLQKGDVADLQQAGVKLLQGETLIKSGTTDRWGEFVFRDLAPGQYRLKLDLGVREVEVRELMVEEPFPTRQESN